MATEIAKKRRWARVAYQVKQQEILDRKSRERRRKAAQRQERKGRKVVCPYCQGRATLVGGAVIYPFRTDLHDRRFYLCAPCGAWVGCHLGTEKPLGVPANAATRQARIQAHDVFDPIWKTGRMDRQAAYAWLAGLLGIRPEACHISWFDEDQCAEVVRLCERYWARQDASGSRRHFLCQAIPLGSLRSTSERGQSSLRGF